MAACLEITHIPEVLPMKEYGLSLTVLADTSKSMLRESRWTDQIECIKAICALAHRATIDGIDVDFALLTFSDTTHLVLGPGPPPCPAPLRSACDQLTPAGGTALPRALEAALAVASGRLSRGRAVHVVLLTDGGGASDLLAPAGPGLTAVKAAGLGRAMLALHCVPLCATADADALHRLCAAAGRGAVYPVSPPAATLPPDGPAAAAEAAAAAAAARMGGLWRRVREGVDGAARLSVTVNGTAVPTMAEVLRSLKIRSDILPTVSPTTAAPVEPGCRYRFRGPVAPEL
jgi:hypothetical protein